jgi:hypothetical protein
MSPSLVRNGTDRAIATVGAGIGQHKAAGAIGRVADERLIQVLGGSVNQFDYDDDEYERSHFLLAEVKSDAAGAVAVFAVLVCALVALPKSHYL